MSSNKKILIIDDEPSNIKVIVDALKIMKYEIFIALNGHDGYNIAVSKNPDIILTDWEMPELSGIETIKLIKKNDQLKDIPIIMVTGKMLDSISIETSFETGAHDYLKKPIDKIELLARIKSMLQLFDSMKKNIELERQISTEKQLKNEMEIMLNKKMLAMANLKLYQNSNNNQELLANLEKIQLTVNIENAQLIQKAIRDFKSEPQSQIWDEFEVYFEQINPEFYSALLRLCPTITKGELRIAAFLRLNMSIKEISAITLQSTNTIKVAKQRLIKRLNIKEQVNPNLFFQQI